MASATFEDRLPPAPARQLIGCPECDLLLHLDAPAPGHVARCPRCAFVLATGVHDGFLRPMAYASAALVLMLLALGFPFLAVTAAGLENHMNLFEAMTSLSRFGANAVAVLVMAFVVFVPGLMMAAVLVLTLLLYNGRGGRVLVPLARALFRLDAWCMADVFAIGVIVSLVKLSTMADVVLGTAFWAYLGFSVCFLLTVTTLDRVSVWSAVDAQREAR
ncbi:MAG: paraquat-inducible protein A [Pseudomonadales bacterium]